MIFYYVLLFLSLIVDFSVFDLVFSDGILLKPTLIHYFLAFFSLQFGEILLGLLCTLLI